MQISAGKYLNSYAVGIFIKLGELFWIHELFPTAWDLTLLARFHLLQASVLLDLTSGRQAASILMHPKK